MSGKRLRIFAGPNGSGKSTLFQDFKTKFNSGYFINADLIEKEILEKGFINLSDLSIDSSVEEFNQFLENSTLVKKALKEGYKFKIKFEDNFLINISKKTHSYEAAFVAAFMRHIFIKSGISFSFETVLSHNSKIDEIKEALNAGYRIYLYYISVESPQISEERVITRVAKGGHPVNSEKIKSRYYQTLEQLSILIPFAYRAYFFDNSGKEYKLLAEILPNKNMKNYIKIFPEWFHKYVIQKLDF